MPRICADGTSAKAGATYCDGCPTGFSCKDGASVACAEGEIPNQHGTDCMACPAGVACPAKKYDKQVACGPGYYSVEGVSHCLASPAGQYAGNTVEVPKDCATGWYSDIAWTSCLQCPPGFQCKDKTARHIALCTPGSYYDGTKGECKDCPAGKMCPIAIPGYRAEGDALTCPDGMFAPIGSFDCEICSPGRDCSKDSTRAKDNALCAALSDYSLGGWDSCTACPKNYECPFGETISRCPVFFYSSLGETHCKPCTDGMDCWDEFPPPCADNLCLDPAQALGPVGCKKGYYSIPLDMTCKPCPKGHFCATDLSTAPVKCVGGTFADEGQFACETCPEEYYSKEGAEYCSPIPPGYRFKTDKTDISICGSRKYSYWGGTGCAWCPDGYLCPQQSGNGYNW